MESDPEDDREEMNLAGFLFGNINKKNQLETDVFDEESKRQIASLTKYIIHNLLLFCILLTDLFVLDLD